MPTEPLSTYRDLMHDGVRRFRQQEFAAHQQEYEALGLKQEPHTLFIACSDSRVDPIALTQSRPGKIFVARNIGNIVPPYGSVVGGVSAVIEYAILALSVKQIIVCGHSNCGAMKGLLNRQSVATLPAVDRWLDNAQAAFSVVQGRQIADDNQMLPEVTRENVLLQLQHLRTHPSVAGKISAGQLAVYGWVYDIGTGRVNEYDSASNRFEPV